MKKVRKSLALDVMDCQVMPTSKRKSLKTEAKQNIKVKSAHMCCNMHSLYIDLMHSNSCLFCTFSFLHAQEEPVVVSLNSSSFSNKRHENILDQGFLLGPSDSAIFPSMVPPVPVSSIFNLKRKEYSQQWTSILCNVFYLNLILQQCFLSSDVKRMGDCCLWTN